MVSFTSTNSSDWLSNSGHPDTLASDFVLRSPDVNSQKITHWSRHFFFGAMRLFCERPQFRIMISFGVLSVNTSNYFCFLCGIFSLMSSLFIPEIRGNGSHCKSLNILRCRDKRWFLKGTFVSHAFVEIARKYNYQLWWKTRNTETSLRQKLSSLHKSILTFKMWTYLIRLLKQLDTAVCDVFGLKSTISRKIVRAKHSDLEGRRYQCPDDLR